MARYSAGFTTPAAAAGAAFCDLRTAASERACIWEIGLFLNAATATSLQLVRPATVGTSSTTVAGQPEDPANTAATAAVGTAWSAAPTISTNVPLRKAMIPAAIGNGIVWTFQNGLWVNISSSILIWNFGAGAGSVLNGYVVWDE